MNSVTKLIEKQLAAFLDAVRIASPIAYALIMVVVFGIGAVLENFTDLAGSLPWLFEGSAGDIIQGLIAFILSSRTKRYLGQSDDGVQALAVMDADHDD